MSESPEEVVARLYGDVEAMRRRGFGTEATRMERVADEFRAALEPIRLVPEHDAILRSGKGRVWLRGRFDAWVEVGAAKWIDGERHYRLCVLPTRLARAEGAAEAERILRAG